MKMLYFVRHAQAIPGESGINDFKRMLAPKGREDALTMGSRLARKGIVPDLLIASPADRALETAHIFAEKLNYPIRRILLREELYQTENTTDLPQILKELPDTYQTVMLVGHEPALSHWANILIPDSRTEFRTTSVVGITLSVSTWQALSAGTGALRFCDFPMQPPSKIYKDARTVMQKLTTMAMEDLLEQLEVGISKPMRKIIKKTSKQFAKELVNTFQISTVEELALGQDEAQSEDHTKAEKTEEDR